MLSWVRFIALLVGGLAGFMALIPVLGSYNPRLNSQCEVSDGWGKYEEWVLGRRFWGDQAALLEKQEDFLRGEYKSLHELRESLNKYAMDERERLERSYRARPELRPRAEQRRADQLREVADDIEAQERERRRTARLDQELAWVRKCKALAKERASR